METYIRNFLQRTTNENARSIAQHAFKVSADGETVVMGAQKKPSPIPIERAPYTRAELEAVFTQGCLFRANEGWLHQKHLRSPIPNGVVICCANGGYLSPEGAMARAYGRLERASEGRYPPACVFEAGEQTSCHWIPRNDIVEEALKEASPRLPVEAVQTVLDGFIARGTVELMESPGNVIHRKVAAELIERGRMTRNPETGRLSFVPYSFSKSATA
jgi:hypothetical protein